MTKKILVLNGPNLNLLGTREPEIYGDQTLSDIQQLTQVVGDSIDLDVDFRQSNMEGKMVQIIQDCKDTHDGIIINAAAYTHTSVAIRDALVLTELPIIEVHITNIYKREDFRKQSYISDIAQGVICGLGTQCYTLALNAIKKFL